MQTPPIPTLEKALLDHLQAAFRLETEIPQKEASLWDYGVRAGKAAVIAYLERKFREQQTQGPVSRVLQQT